MSVAFRRENDDEHLEPKFERPIVPGPNLVTPRGLVLLRKAVARAEAMLATATDETDRAAAARDLRYWQTRLATAEPAPAPEPGEVGIGSRVRLRLDGVERTIAVVGGDEADPAADRLAFYAPLARALMGAGEGDMVSFAGRADAIEVLAVEEGA